ncbi:methyltransferase domain-containing protein [Actinoplanes sp. NBRC 103695]|uniref:methyltransferase domain-containing protein n=1 Tax=Actinoplanes sp. NBRC 103695 TaxID=3032202 RepID=UPI002553B827|nr:methyltransferase domain-containing protein [Actinoplanes sp. NBRC 103695]
MTVAYLDHAATTEPGRRYKRSLLEALDLRPGLTVLDVGCGPGTDLPGMVAAVTHPPSRSGRASGPEALCSEHIYASPLSVGRVIGVDRDPGMADEARRRCPSSVEILVGDAHELPLDDASVDRARVDRVLQHLADPERALAELHRVVRPGGTVVLADPDWDTLAIADPDTATSRAYTRYVTGHVVRNATIGRELARLLHAAGFAVVEVVAESILFTDYAEAEAILRMPDVARRGWESGALDPHASRAWLSRLAAGPFVGGFTFYTVKAHRPAP